MAPPVRPLMESDRELCWLKRFAMNLVSGLRKLNSEDAESL